MPSPGDIALLACAAEVTAPKAGNVHPGASFADATWLDFVTSAVAIRPILDRAAEVGVGETILACVQETRAAIGHNTNLGMILLLAPLCSVRTDETLADGIHRALSTLTPKDARLTYEAIRQAQPGGLGAADRADVRNAPDIGLIDAMRLAAQRDAVARQYANDFADVLNVIAPRLAALYRDGMTLDRAIVTTHLEQLAREPDSLIRRKCGDGVAAESQRRAAAVLNAGWPDAAESQTRFEELDAWLRGDGHRRNPGTSADLIAAGLYAAMRDGDIAMPFSWSGSIVVPT